VRVCERKGGPGGGLVEKGEKGQKKEKQGLRKKKGKKRRNVGRFCQLEGAKGEVNEIQQVDERTRVRMGEEKGKRINLKFGVKLLFASIRSERRIAQQEGRRGQ